MLSETAAKKWRTVMYAEAVPCILNCYIPVLGKTTVWFLTLFAATEALYVLLQPNRWKRWVYSDHACWGCVLVFLYFLFLYANTFPEKSCALFSFYAVLPREFLFAFWMLPMIARWVKGTEEYDRIEGGTHLVLLGYTLSAFNGLVQKIEIACKGDDTFFVGFDSIVFFIFALPLLCLASFVCYFVRHRKTGMPYLRKFFINWGPFLFAVLFWAIDLLIAYILVKF